MVFKDFYESGPEYLKIKKGEPTEFYYILRVCPVQSAKFGKCFDDINLNEVRGSHVTYGQLLKIKNSRCLFPMFLPELESGHFLQMRLDENAIDLEIITPNSKTDKPKDIHHKIGNSGFYYKRITYNGWTIEIAVAKNIGYETLTKNFYDLMNKQNDDSIRLRKCIYN